jgi:hypothetical protein
MKTEFRVNNSKFKQNLNRAKDAVFESVRNEVRNKGRAIIKDAIGQYKSGNGTVNLLKLARDHSEKNVSVSQAYHQLIAMDQKNTTGKTIAEFVDERWYIPSVFAVTHSHNVGSYVYLVGINIATQVALGTVVKGLKLSTKVLSKGVGIAAKAAKTGRTVVAKGKRISRAFNRNSGLLGKGIAFSVMEKVDNVVSTVERAIQSTIELGAIQIYNGVENVLAKERKI